MRIEVLKKHKIRNAEEALNHVSEVIDNLNKTKSGKCWVCDRLNVMNWGVLLPQDGADSLGFGGGDEHAPNGDTNFRIAFFTVCPEHDLSDPEIIDKITMEVRRARQELSN